jgi:hypothetical protein
MPSPGVTQNKQPPLNMNSSSTLGNMEQGKSTGEASGQWVLHLCCWPCGGLAHAGASGGSCVGLSQGPRCALPRPFEGSHWELGISPRAGIIWIWWAVGVMGSLCLVGRGCA